MAEFDPYYKWLGIPPVEQPPHHYRLLGVVLYEADPEVIEAAVERHTSYLQTVSSGPHVAEAQRLLNEISAARRLLLNPTRREAYDTQLRAELAARQSPAPPPVAPRPPVVEPLPPPIAVDAPTPAVEVSAAQRKSKRDKASAATEESAGSAERPAPQARRRSGLPLTSILAALGVGGIVLVAAVNYLALRKVPTIADQTPKSNLPASDDGEKRKPNLSLITGQTQAGNTTAPTATATPPAATPTPKAALTQKLVAHWTFDSPEATWLDLIAQAEATAHGATRQVDPRHGGVLQFAGGGQFATLAATVPETASVAFWVSTEQPSPDTDQWSASIPLVNADDDLRVVLSDGKVGCCMKGDTTVIRSLKPINDGQWHHIAVTRDAKTSTKTVKLFVDGSEENLSYKWTATTRAPGPLALGRFGSGGASFVGRIDDVRIYDYALSIAEVAKLHTPPAVQPPPKAPTQPREAEPKPATPPAKAPAAKPASPPTPTPAKSAPTEKGAEPAKSTTPAKTTSP